MNTVDFRKMQGIISANQKNAATFMSDCLNADSVSSQKVSIRVTDRSVPQQLLLSPDSGTADT